MALLLVLLSSYVSTSTGCISKSNLIPTEDMEDIAQGIDKSLMCPVCPSETIDQSQVELANQMRIMVRDKLAQGESRDEILQFFVDRYGLVVLAEPPKTGFNILVWLIPPIIFLFGIIVLIMTIIAMRRNQLGDSEYTLVTTPSLEQYLEQVDKEIGQIGLSNTYDSPSGSNPKPQSQYMGTCISGAD